MGWSRTSPSDAGLHKKLLLVLSPSFDRFLLNPLSETNTSVFVGDLDPNVTAKHLKQLFRHYGQLGHGLLRAISRAEEALKIPQGTQYGVVVLQVNKFVKDDEL
ncbi:polyadenylate-binding protein RBP45 [Tanacetum coccineum]